MEINRENLLSLINTGVKRDALSISGLERDAGVPKDTVRDFLRGKTQVLRADKLQKILRILEPQHELHVSGVIEESAIIKPAAEEKAVPCPPGCDPAQVIAVRIASDVMLPVFHRGWVIYYSRSPDISIPAISGGWQVPYVKQPASKKQAGEKFAEFIGKPCIVGFGPGKTALGTLKRRPGGKTYDLVNYNGSDIKNIAPQWAAKIIFIKTE